MALELDDIQTQLMATLDAKLDEAFADGVDNFGGGTNCQELLGYNDIAGSTYPLDKDTVRAVFRATIASVFKTNEDWRVVGDVGNPGFLDGWDNYDTGAYGFMSFRRDAFGMVHIQGVVGGVSVPSTIFALPPGYCPSFIIVAPCVSSPSFGAIEIDPAGNVNAIIGSASLMAINVSFKAVF